MKFFNLSSAIAAVYLMADEIPAGSAPQASTLEAAPGCEPPKPERKVFDKLTAAGGKFLSIPAADGSVHFDVSLVPTTKNEKGEDVPGLPEWPRSKDANGKAIPLPWEGHNRNTHLALTVDCFDTDAGYFLYRAYEAYEKAVVALDKYTEAKTGVAKNEQRKAKQQEKILSGLTALAEGLSEEDQRKVREVMAMLAAQRGAPIAA